MRVGVDEAGKGPVLGPMVAAAVAVPDAAVLPDDVADSKRVDPERREAIDAALRDDGRVEIGVAAVEVERIDDPATDMNTLTVDGQAEAVGHLLEGLDGAGADLSLLADAGDTSEARFARRLGERLPDREGLAVTARHGADDEDPVVAAASIVAKVERDARVAALAQEFGELGSGYPSDPATRSFLEAYVEDHGELPACARTSWQTCEDVLASVEQAGIGEF